MQKVKNNSELFVLLFIIFFIFVTLVLYYENKLKQFYYDNNNEYLILNLKVDKIVNNQLVKLDGYYVELDPNIIMSLKKDLNYTFKFKTNRKLVLKGDLNDLFKKYEVKEIQYGIIR